VDLEFSAEETELRDNVRGVLDKVCPTAVVRRVFDGDDDGREVWDRMCELDWPALAVPEHLGGLGQGFVDVAIVCEELGRAVAPGPYLATVTQFVPALLEVAHDHRAVARCLEDVVGGRSTGTLAVTEDGRIGVDSVRTVANRGSGGWVLDGVRTTVMDGDRADEIVVVARLEGTAGDDGLGVFLVRRDQVEVTARTLLDPTVHVADLTLRQVEVPDDRVLAGPGQTGVAPALRRALEQATIALAASTVGTCRRIFEMTLDYAKVREQFGRPIGSFQALKHRLADMFLAVERATALVYFAALTVHEDDPRRAAAASLAKSAAGDCQRLLAEDGLQLHGGVGMTWEHDLHLFLKRAKVGEALFGTSVAHRVALAELLAQGAAR
jgi:alkylation response protein AidB-like acyl-CoA dehydrogenase